MIKLLLVIPTLDQSGAEKQLTLLACGLPRDRFDIRVIALTRGGPYERQLKDAGIPLTILEKRWKFDPLALRRLRKIIADWQPDIVHTWLFAANAYGRLVAGRRPRPRIIISERCVDTWKSGWQHFFDRRLIRRTTRMIANSQSVAAFYREHGFPADRLVVIPNAIDIPPDAPIDRAAVLAELVLPPNAKIVIYVGRLARQKRLKDLIWAMELLRQLDEKSYSVIVGDGPEREWLVQFARDIGCLDRFRFLGHRDDTLRLLRAANLFWMASDFEGQSNSVMEAMAAGLPVIASDIPPNRELVVDGETGLFVKVGDTAQFAKKAQQLLADPDLSQRLGHAGRQRMQSEFSVRNMIDAHATLYREVTEERGGDRETRRGGDKEMRNNIV